MSNSLRVEVRLVDVESDEDGEELSTRIIDEKQTMLSGGDWTHSETAALFESLQKQVENHNIL